MNIQGSAVVNSSPLYIGNTPYFGSKCANSMYALISKLSYFDEIEWFNRALSMEELQAEATSALGAIDTSTLMLGCANCGVNQALQSCIQGYNLCTSMQLMLSGEMVAMANGWIYKQDQQIWSRGIELGTGGVAPYSDGSPRKGLALCCKQ